MAYRRKRLLSNKDMVVLHLSAFFDRYRDSPDVPIDITQTGLASAIGVTRQNIPRTINTLLKEELIETRKTHVIGFKLKRGAYFLTSSGVSHASIVKNRLSEELIEVSSSEGMRRYYIKDICNTLPFKVRVIDIVREVAYSKLSLESLLALEMQNKKQFLDYSNGFHKPRSFFGRKSEIDEIDKWFHSDNSQLLAVRGIAGIGKTTLIAQASKPWQDKNDIFCFKIHPWTGLRNLIRPLAEFLATIGKNEILAYVQSHEQTGIAELHLLLSKNWKDIDIIQIYDDCHNANPEVRLFLKMMHEVVQASCHGKIIVVGRTVPRIYNRRDVGVSGSVVEMQLEGLDRENSRELMLGQNVPVEHFDSIFNATKGHPLMLELSRGSEIAKVGDIQKFVLEEFLLNLENSERELLDYISVFRYPINEKMACPNQSTFMAIADKGILHELPGNRFQLHDAVKSHLYNAQRKSRLLGHHSRAADYYLEQGDERSLLETIFHRVSAEEFDLAAEISIEYREVICNSGNSRELSALVNEIFEKSPDLDRGMLTALHVTAGECMTVTGKWDEALKHYADAIASETGLEKQEFMARAHLGSGEIFQHRSDMETAKSHLEKALALFGKLEDGNGLARTYYQFGVIHELTGEYDKSLRMFKKCKALAEKDSNRILLANALNAFGRVHVLMGNEKRARDEFEKAELLLEQDRNYRELAKVHCGLGALAFNRNDIESAIQHFSKAEKIADSIGDLWFLGHALMNLASAYLEKPDLVRAIDYAEKAKEIFTMLGDKRMIALVTITYAAIWDKKERWNDAVECLNMSIEQLNEIDDMHGVARAKYKLGIIYQTMTKTKLAIQTLVESREIYNKLGDNQIVKEIDCEIRKLG